MIGFLRKIWKSRKGVEDMTSTGQATASVAHDDPATAFRVRLLTEEKDGADMVATFERLLKVHPTVAASVVRCGSLGALSYANAVGSLSTYRRTGAAVLPQSL